MELITEENVLGIDPEHPWSADYEVLAFADGSVSCLPHNLLHDPLDPDAPIGTLQIGRCSSIGTGSLIKFAAETQSVQFGRFVTAGQRLRILLNSRYESRTLSTYLFSMQACDIKNVATLVPGDCLIKNDVWIGDDVTILSGAIIENGCIIEPGSLLARDFRSEPYGIYAGNPARLVGFRFSPAMCEALAAFAWWERSMEWVRTNNEMFLIDLQGDEKNTLDRLREIEKNQK